LEEVRFFIKVFDRHLRVHVVKVLDMHLCLLLLLVVVKERFLRGIVAPRCQGKLISGNVIIRNITLLDVSYELIERDTELLDLLGQKV